MAWMWWLLAPVVSTVLGAAFIGWRARRAAGTSGRRHNPMAEHQAVLSALTKVGGTEPEPVTMRVLDQL